MIDFTKLSIKPEQIQDAVEKTKTVAVKAVDYNGTVAKESLKFFNDVTDKYFYAYTTKVAEAINQGTEYAKEFIQTGTIKSLYTGSAKN